MNREQAQLAVASGSKPPFLWWLRPSFWWICVSLWYQSRVMATGKALRNDKRQLEFMTRIVELKNIYGSKVEHKLDIYVSTFDQNLAALRDNPCVVRGSLECQAFLELVAEIRRDHRVWNFMNEFVWETFIDFAVLGHQQAVLSAARAGEDPLEAAD